MIVCIIQLIAISAQMQIATLVHAPEKVIELDIQQTQFQVGSPDCGLIVFNSLHYRFSLWKQSCRLYACRYARTTYLDPI